MDCWEVLSLERIKKHYKNKEGRREKLDYLKGVIHCVLSGKTEALKFLIPDGPKYGTARSSELLQYRFSTASSKSTRALLSVDF